MANSHPPPNACPLTAAITGFRRVVRYDHGAIKLLAYASANVRDAISFISAPAANARSEPVRTMQEMVGDSS